MKIETKSLNVLCHWYHDERVVAFILKNTERHSVDTFADWIIETLTTWPTEKPLLIVYDISASGFTPYTRRRAIDVHVAVPTENIRGRTAIVFPNTSLGRFMKIFANKMMQVQNPHMERRFFTHLDQAVTWTNEFVDQKSEVELL